MIKINKDKTTIGWCILVFIVSLAFYVYGWLINEASGGENLGLVIAAAILGTIILLSNIFALYILLKGKMTEQMEVKKVKIIKSLKQLGYGILVLALGSGISLVSFAINSKSYYVAIGAITSGGIYFLIGLVKLIASVIPSLVLYFKEQRQLIKPKKHIVWAVLLIMVIIILSAVYVNNRQSNIVEPEMVFVQGGTFTMGCTDENERTFGSDAKPVHQVTVNSFNISKYEITQGQWKAIMGTTIDEQRGAEYDFSSGKGKKYPMYYVSWNDVQEFIHRLNATTGKNYRLPTEAEWEYAARGGVKSQDYKKFSGSDNVNDVAWSKDNSGRGDGWGLRSHPVGKKQPNELGIYDMSGNVAEWCSNWGYVYSDSSQNNPQGPSLGTERAYRGGSYEYYYPLVYVRSGLAPDKRERYIGFRLVHP